jgi:hypothetical protein
MAEPLSEEYTEALKGLGARDVDVEMITVLCQRKRAPTGAARASYKVPRARKTGIRRLMRLSDPSFSRRFGFDKTVLEDHIIKPLGATLKALRDPSKRVRKHQLPLLHRCLRFLDWMHGKTTEQLAYDYGQGESTCHTDCVLLLEGCREGLVSDHVRMPLAGSAEYKAVVGMGIFAGRMPNVVYCADMTFIHIPTPPARIQGIFFSKPKEKHGMFFSTYVAGDGGIMGISGPHHGSTCDPRALMEAGICERLKRHVDPFLRIVNRVSVLV